MLAERGDALHVFCHAPRPALIARCMSRDGLDEEAAAKLVDETNSHREQWVKKHWSREWRDPASYHLSTNTDWLGIDGAVNLIVFAARQRFKL